MIRMHNISKIYDRGKIDVKALCNVDFHIEKGDFVTIMGPSGSGKSTLMNIIGCLDKPTGGEYWLNGNRVQDLSDDQLAEIRNREVGFIFQNFNLLPYASAYENVELPLLFSGISTRKRKEKVINILQKVGLSDRIHHKPNELSGGQQQRVAIARALVNNPTVILADEPTGNLDTKSGEEIMEIFLNLWKEGNTIILITHDHKVSQYSKRIIEIIDGKIYETQTKGN